jgi:ABC-type phosphate transport system ATPase subunit
MNALNFTKKTKIKLRLTKFETTLDDFNMFTKQIEALTGVLWTEFNTFEKTFYENTNYAPELNKKRDSTSISHIVNSQGYMNH